MRASLIRTMSRTPCFSNFFGIGSMPHSGMPGPPCGPAVWSTSTLSGVDVELRVVEPGVHVVVVLEHHRRAGVLQQPRVGGGRLDHGAARREVAAQHGEPTFGLDRVVERPDDVVVVDLGAGDVLAERARR